MNTLLSRRASVRPAALAALFAALLAALLALGAPAQAHDTLLESDPADGATLESSPEAITLTFSADVLEVSPLVRITDENGEQLAEITPSIDGPVATATLEEPLPAGTSTVQWRVVSSDGHPIEGTFEVAVEQDAAAEETTEAPAEESSPAEESAPAETAAPAEEGEQATAEAAEEESGSSMTPLLIVFGVVVVGAVVAVLLIMRRRD
ncbi:MULTISPECIES: copper resistance CopC family protein [Brachybacterium]|uniref:Copper resistance protein CopC n=2 Tax=Brachybacterium TaxID=43668 RepID=A0A426SL73_9MICO|nr:MULTISPECIES: copper resistance CopC family protein [Brachybacterium]RRR18974.1 copper resistance protein CopC [Brachybacterium paraconglomeratum]GLI30501.1 copper resistance protein CopC [Brachybacterium conglomeratum]GLK05015.1 copper resistance protein CopC [Brachybacterium conglomeratum]